MSAAGLAFDAATRTGVVLVCDMTELDGTVRYCVIAESLDEAYDTERRLLALSIPAAV